MGRVLVTGASGFIGSFVVEEALRRGLETWAGVRNSSSRKNLQANGIKFIELDFSDKEELTASLLRQKEEVGAFDTIIHCAGVTKCLSSVDFERVNYEQTKIFVEQLIELKLVPKQFIFVSTLSVYGPIREKDYTEIRTSDPTSPNTAYGNSKLKTENYLRSLTDFPYLIFRPTGVYGPREKDYFLMAKSIKSGVDFSVGFRKQELTFVYVKDLVQAIFKGVEKGITRRAYFVTDGETYASRDFSDLIQRELGKKWVIRIKAPLILLKVISLCAEFLSRLTRRPSTLNLDKYKIMKQRNWRCDLSNTVEELGYTPEYNLERGVNETITWYKKEGWL